MRTPRGTAGRGVALAAIVELGRSRFCICLMIYDNSFVPWILDYNYYHPPKQLTY